MRIFLGVTILMFVLSVAPSLALEKADLVFYFPFEDFDGNTALDQSGKGHNGDIKGKIEIAVGGGKFGNAAEFEKTSYIDMNGPEIPDEDIPRDEITLCAWAKCENTGDHQALFNARAGDSTWVIHPELRSDGVYRWLLRTDGSVNIFDIQAGAVVWDEWVHYAGVYDGKDGTLYINGEKVAGANGGAKIAKDWALGARIGYNIDNARPFTGLMDDLFMWKKAFTQDEVKAIMTQSIVGVLGEEAVSPVGSLTTVWGGIKAF